MCKVLLIYPYFQTGKNQDVLFHPLGIAMLSAKLKTLGIHVLTLDCTFLTMGDAIRIAEDYHPDIAGIYVMTTMSQNALLLLDKIKQNNQTCICVAGGPLPTLYPSKFAERFDFVFRGESAISFPDFCKDYSKSPSNKEFYGKMDATNYPGIFSIKHGAIEQTIKHLSSKEINVQPNPDRSEFDHTTYQRLSREKTERKIASIMMTYGCPHHCDFCSKPIFGDELRYRLLDNIFDEILEIKSLGYDSLWIADDNFTFNEDFLRRFCLRMIEENLGIAWSCLSRVTLMAEESYQLMKQAGCNKVYLGIESGNDQVLKLMNKGTNTAMIRHAVSSFKRNGLACCGFFIVGYPGETIETIEETFSFASSLELDQISFNVPYPLPGSRLFERVKGVLDDDWDFENETRFLYESEFDEQWLKKRIEATMTWHNKRNLSTEYTAS
jgi:anaerobic magnesium-protoporphyrin IX monomethyl ester cyclase